ncbi:MAG: hypothetical protein JSU63_17535 [Phycisphaerales bacterium]|nr:MAG: hypothetical protein JSU63_17535 [Phycisphaerales bacterium]
MEVARTFSKPMIASALQIADGNSVGAGQLVLLAGALICLTLVMRSTFRRVRSSRRQPRSTARQMYADLQSESEAKRDLQQTMLELDQLARQIQGRIDTRFAKLEAVIRDADERIDKLSRLVNMANGRSTLDVTVGDNAPASRCPEPNGRHAAIYRLADDGLEPVQIADKVGKTTGEIELILALRKTRDHAKQSPTHAASPPGKE